MIRVLRTLLVGEEELLEPGDRAGMHPLLQPLSRHETGIVTGLLPDGRVVRQGSSGLSLRAWTVESLVVRLLATREDDGEEVPVVEGVYGPGSLATSGLPLKAFLLLKAGGFPDLYEDLSRGHEARGDVTAALVTADRACARFPGWGRPQVYRAWLYERLGRLDEARDCALSALQCPVWTLGAPWAAVAKLAQAPAAPDFRAWSQDPVRTPVERAEALMDAVALEEGDWDEVREEVARLYAEGERPAIAAWVRGESAVSEGS